MSRVNRDTKTERAARNAAECHLVDPEGTAVPHVVLVSMSHERESTLQVNEQVLVNKARHMWQVWLCGGLRTMNVLSIFIEARGENHFATEDNTGPQSRFLAHGVSIMQILV